jgi:opacity protein-like surface antigen
MRVRNILGLAVTALALSATAVTAQQRAWGGLVQGGIPVPMSDFDNAVGSAFGWGFGARYAPEAKNFALRLDIENSRFNIDNPDILSNAAWDADDGYARIWDFQLNGEFGMRNDAKFRLYGLAGIGYGNVYAAVTNGTLASGCYWDPWWGYICGTGVVDEILADGDRWGFSGRVGGGASYKIGTWGPTLFIEARYSMIMTGGDTYENDPQGRETKNTTWLPVMFGVKF